MKMQLRVLILLMVGIFSPARAAEFNITEANEQFSENALTIKAGDTLQFKNDDKVIHNIQVSDSQANTDDKGLQQPGEMITETLNQPGEYIVHCGFHPTMKLKVTVQSRPRVLR